MHQGKKLLHRRHIYGVKWNDRFDEYGNDGEADDEDPDRVADADADADPNNSDLNSDAGSIASLSSNLPICTQWGCSFAAH